MATTEEMQEFVERGAALFAEAEYKIANAERAVKELVPLMKEGRELGFAGYLQSSRMAADLRSAYGKVAEAESLVFAIHAEGTKLAQDQGVDVPQPADGGGNR